MKLPRPRARAPLAIAAFMAMPLFFSALMAASLALERPRVIQWTSGGRLLTTWHDPTRATEARVWLWALVPPALLVLAGLAASFLRLGFYVSCAAGIVIAVAVAHRLDTWAAHHAARFPNGVDLIPSSNPASDKFDHGQWEAMARSTAVSLEHWTIAIALAAASIAAGLSLRRRYGRRPPLVDATLADTVHAPTLTRFPAETER